MIKNIKLKGFSLVEVMILFTMLSVIMAASMTMVTRKSSAVPPKVSHGLYRCIYTPEGLIEEEYSGTDRLYPTRHLGGNQCTFRVPKAAMYKIDMYSAGSGGTEYAEIDSAVSDRSSNVTYTLDNLTPDASAQAEQLYVPTDIEFYEMLNGKYVVSSVFSGDAGSGGGLYFTYPSVSDVSCLSEEHQSLADRSGDIAELKRKLAIVENFQPEDALDYLQIRPLNSGFPTYEDQIRIVVPTTSYGWPNWSPEWDNSLIYNPDNNTDLTLMQFYYRDPIIIYRNTMLDPTCPYVDENGNAITAYYPCLSPDSLIYYMINYLGRIFSYSYDHSAELQNISADIFAGYNVSAVEDRTTLVYKNKSVLSYGDNEPTAYGYVDIAINNLVYSWRQVAANESTRYAYELNYPVCTNTINYLTTGTLPQFRLESVCGVRLKPLVYDMINEMKLLEKLHLKKQIMQMGYTDIKDVPEFAAYYNNQSVMNDKVKKQIRDYCKMEYKKIYNDLGIFNNDTKIDQEIQYGNRRVISTLGGNEGLGKLSTKIYKISNAPRIAILGGGSFTTYASNIKNDQLKPVYCDKDMKNCSSEPPNSDCPTFWNFFSQANVGCVKKGSDSNLSGTVNYNALSTTITHNNVKTVNYSSSNTEDMGALTNGKKYVKLEDGKAPERISAWPKTSLTNTPAVSALPEGGKAPKVYIEVNNENYTRNPDCDFTAWTCPKKEEIVDLLAYVSSIFSTTPYLSIANYYESWFKANVKNNGVIFNKNVADKAGIDTIGTSSNATASEESGSNYKVISSDGITHDTPVESLNPSTFPMFQEPYIEAKSWKWRKTYKLGGPGNPGKFLSLTGTDLGTSCTLTVPAPGEIYRKGIDDPFVMNSKLSTSITCRNNQGKVVFNNVLEGNGYNDNIITEANQIENNTYQWTPDVNEDGGVHTVTLVNNPTQPNWRPTSVLSVLVNRFFRNNNTGNVYDIQNYGVGAAGGGTTLLDHCLVRKGRYQREVFYNIKYNDSSDNITTRRTRSKTGCEYLLIGDTECDLSSTYTYPISSLSEKNIKINGSEKNVYRDGNYRGYNCYGENAGSADATEGHWTLQSNSPIVESGLIDIDATRGGGGAIVISW